MRTQQEDFLLLAVFSYGTKRARELSGVLFFWGGRGTDKNTQSIIINNLLRYKPPEDRASIFLVTQCLDLRDT